MLGGTDTKPESTLIAADWGTMVHHWKSCGEVKAVNKRENLVPLFHKKLKEGGVKREDWWPNHDQGFFHEIATAVSPFKDYLWCPGGDPEEWKKEQSDDYCTGTTDGYGWMFDALWVDDLKTGRWVTLEEHIQQLRFYALGIARRLDYRGPVHVTLTHWPRYKVDNKPLRFGRVVEQDELLAFEKDLARLRDEVLRGREKPELMKLVSGPQCLWCPSKNVCSKHEEQR